MECFKYAFNILMHKYIPLQVSHTLTGVDYPYRCRLPLQVSNTLTGVDPAKKHKKIGVIGAKRVQVLRTFFGGAPENPTPKFCELRAKVLRTSEFNRNQPTNENKHESA